MSQSSSTFIPQEILVSNDLWVIRDPEFNQIQNLVTWTNGEGNLYVAPINTQTGEFILEETILVDTNLAPIPSFRPRTGTGNGPEWLYTDEGGIIVYTKALGDTQFDWRVAQAKWNGTIWETSIITEGYTPLGSQTVGVPPRILYILPSPPGGEYPLAWRDFGASSGNLITDSADSFVRWVNDESSAIIYAEKIDGLEQVILYDLDSAISEILTNSDTKKEYPFMWLAPDFDNENLFIVTETDSLGEKNIGVYDFNEDQQNWELINTIESPTSNQDIRFAKPFVYENTSYIVFLVEEEKGGFSDIWISTIDPEGTYARQVTDPNVQRIRNDWEVFFTETEPKIYYTEKNTALIYNVSTGLAEFPLIANKLENTGVLVSDPNISLPDPEFDSQGNRVTWQDDQGNLWVADIDPETGLFGVLDNNTGEFITGLNVVYQQEPIDINLSPINGTKNGPEWIYTQNGASIIYTKEDEQDNKFIGIAQLNGSEWNTGFLNDGTGWLIEGFYPIGTLNPNDENPIIGYIMNESRDRAWIQLNDTSVTGNLPEGSGRWVEVPNYYATITIINNPEDVGRQYYTYDIYTEELTQITNDEFVKYGSGFMWEDPQYDSLFFMSSENSQEINENLPRLLRRNQIGIYQNIEGNWTRVKTINSPASDQEYLHSVEPFVYDGKSYLSMVTLNEQNERGIWIVEVNLEENISYQVNTDGLVGTLNDPETYINENNGFIYYTVIKSDETRTIYKNNLETIIMNNSFIPNDVVVSDPHVSLPDPEFDLVNYYVTWQTFDNDLFVAKVDPVTGDLILNEGSGELLDTNLVPIFSLADGSGTGNGSEFVYTKRGSEILYSKIVNRDGGEKWDLGISTLTKNGWKAGVLEGGQNAFSPIGSLDPYDESPQVWGLLRTPQNPTGIDPKIGGWLNIDNPSESGKLPFEPTSGGRFIAGENSFVITTRIDGVNQVVSYNTDAETTTQLTFDDQFTKDDPFMWQAPEYDNELVFFAKKKIIDPEATKDQKGYRSIGVYRQIDGEWVEFKTIESPSPDKPFIESPEFFVYNGKSYVFFLVDNSRGEKTETDLWLAGIDEDVDFYRQLDDPNLQIIGSDPEYIITENGAFVYYSEIADNQEKTRIIHRTDTGLGLPEDQVLQGTQESDRLIGSAGKDRLSGRNGNDLLSGGANDDILIGGNGNDELFGNHGDDELFGVGNNDLGSNSIDILTGGEGFDIFVLGNENGIFYAGKGRRDFARITDFNLEEDTIRLKGSLGQYSAKNTSNGSILFVKETGEEIALLENIRAGDLNQSNFTFV